MKHCTRIYPLKKKKKNQMKFPFWWCKTLTRELCRRCGCSKMKWKTPKQTKNPTGRQTRKEMQMRIWQAGCNFLCLGCFKTNIGIVSHLYAKWTWRTDLELGFLSLLSYCSDENIKNKHVYTLEVHYIYQFHNMKQKCRGVTDDMGIRNIRLKNFQNQVRFPQW